MKTLVAGRSAVLDAAAASLYSELGTEIGRVGHLREALAHPSTESLAVVAPLLSEEDLSLLPALAGRGMHLVLLSDVAAVDLRSRALQEGALDVLFPPITAARIVVALDARAAVSRGPLRRAGFRANLQPPAEGEAFDANVAALSTQHVELEISERRPATGDVFRIVLHAPSGRFGAWVRIADSTRLGAGGARVAARFLGLTADESATLVDLADSLPQIPDEIQRLLHAVDRLDMDRLAEASDVRLPALLQVEKEGIARGDGAIGAAAVARIAALLVGDALEKDPEAVGVARVAAVLEASGAAQESLRSNAAIAELEEPAKLAAVRDLQKRVANAAERVRSLSGVAAREAPSLRAIPARRWDLLSGRGRWAVLTAGAFAFIAGVVGVGAVTRTPTDPARTAVAATPVLEFRGIRAQSVTKEKKRAVVVVDGSWFTATEDDRRGFAVIARQNAGSPKTVEIQDTRARPLARVDGKKVVLLPVPAP